MSDTAVVFPELELVDSLISGLEALVAESDETPLRIDLKSKPRRAMYRILNVSTPTEKRAHSAEAIYMDSDTIMLRCTDTQAVRQTQMEITVQAEKSGRGEVMAIVQGKVRDLKRVRGGYDIDIEILEMKKTRLTPGQKLRECINNGDVTGWNRWCHDISGSIELMGMDMRMMDLNGYDLCCADFSGSDFSGANLSGAILSGADLSHCIMEKVTAVGADLFNARMNRSQALLLQQSGMPEVESIVFGAPPLRDSQRIDASTKEADGQS